MWLCSGALWVRWTERPKSISKWRWLTPVLRPNTLSTYEHLARITPPFYRTISCITWMCVLVEKLGDLREDLHDIQLDPNDNTALPRRERRDEDRPQARLSELPIHPKDD